MAKRDEKEKRQGARKKKSGSSFLIPRSILFPLTLSDIFSLFDLPFPRSRFTLKKTQYTSGADLSTKN